MAKSTYKDSAVSPDARLLLNRKSCPKETVQCRWGIQKAIRLRVVIKDQSRASLLPQLSISQTTSARAEKFQPGMSQAQVGVFRGIVRPEGRSARDLGASDAIEGGISRHAQ